MLLYVNEQEEQLLVEVLASALGAFRDIEMSDYVHTLKQREAMMLRLQQRLVGAQASGLLVGEPESRRAAPAVGVSGPSASDIRGL